MDLIIVGGGAAGFFAAINSAEANQRCHVTILEKSRVLLSKVRVSGGGRCNVAPACFDPAELVQHYPRGGKALRGPFTRFQPRDTVAWFEQHGVALKTESDGRIFPVTDRSETIVNCLLNWRGGSVSRFTPRCRSRRSNDRARALRCALIPAGS